MKLADLPLDTVLPPRIREAGTDDRGRCTCPECGGGLFMTDGHRFRCRVCEGEFLEVKEAHDLIKR
jgi:hypothetical protein